MAATQYPANSLTFCMIQDYMNLTVTFLKDPSNYQMQKDAFLRKYVGKEDGTYASRMVKALENKPSGHLKSIFKDYWNYIQKHGIAENTEHYFGGLCMDGNKLIIKYPNNDGSRNEFVYKIVMAFVEWKGFEMQVLSGKIAA